MTETKDSWEEEFDDNWKFLDNLSKLGFSGTKAPFAKQIKSFIRKVETEAEQRGKKLMAEGILTRFQELFDFYHHKKSIAPPPLLTMIKELQATLSSLSPNQHKDGRNKKCERCVVGVMGRCIYCGKK